MTDKQWIQYWENLVNEVKRLTTIDEHEPVQARANRVARLEQHPEEWFNYYFPAYAYAPPAPFHRQASQRVISQPEWCEVRLWSRELAKSTRTMMEVLYLALVGHPMPPASKTPRLPKRYVLLISNSLDNAERLLMPYRANLECNNRIIQDYGPQKSLGNWQSAEFVTNKGVAFRALGAGQSPRGTRNDESRPDIILFDDVDTDADCLNREIVGKRWRWIEEAAIGTRSVSQPTTLIFCGNRIAPDCTIVRATRIADHVDEVNIRDGTGKSTWPEKNSELDIDRVLSQKSYAAAQKEYFNNPITEGSVFAQMAYKPAAPLASYHMLLCYTDPSYKDTNDYKATVLVGRLGQEYHVIHCFLEQATTAAMIGWHYHIMDLVGHHACYYFIEEVFMQDVIRKEISDARHTYGRTIPIRGDTRKKPDKYTRIESLLEPLHRNGQLYLNEAQRHNPHMQRLAEQFLAFAPGSRAHDDGPDAVEGAIWLLLQKARIRTANSFQSFVPPSTGNRW